jgi:hypothetical protein
VVEVTLAFGAMRSQKQDESAGTCKFQSCFKLRIVSAGTISIPEETRKHFFLDHVRAKVYPRFTKKADDPTQLVGCCDDRHTDGRSPLQSRALCQ